MPSVVATGVVAAGVGSSLIGANAAKGAAKAQTNAANAASANEMAMYNQTRADLTPFMSVGTSALSQLAQLFGLAPPTIAPASTVNGGNAMAPGGVTDAQMAQLLQDRPDVLAAYNTAVNGDPARGIKPADKNSPAYAQAGLDSPLNYARNWYANKGGSASYTIPTASPGQPATLPGATANPSGLLPGANGSPLSNFLMQTPGYQFGMDQGVQALDRSAASRGLTLSGGQMKDLTSFGNNYALQAAWQPYVSELNTLATSGQNAAAGVGTAGANAAANAGSATMAAGESAASGTIGAANSYQTALDSALKGFQMYNSSNSGGWGKGAGTILGADGTPIPY